MYVSLSTFYEFTVFTFLNNFPFIKKKTSEYENKVHALKTDYIVSNVIENRNP